MLERFLERRDAPRDRRLADAKRACRGERAPVTGHGEEVAKVVPVEHRRPV